MTDELWNYIRERQKDGKVVLATEEGLAECDLEGLCGQPVDGLLYDLNRGELVSLATGGERAMNDIAAAQVIRYLHRKMNEYRDMLNGKQ